MKTKHLMTLATCLATSLFTVPGQAQQAGDNILYIGYAQLSPDSSLGPVSNSNPVITGSHATDNTTAQVQSASTTVLTLLHMVTDNFGAELTLGVPPTMKSTLTAPNAAGFGLTGTPMPNALSQTVSFPSLMGKYFFNTPADKFRPYLGLGINYTEFSNITPNMSYNTVAQFAGSGVSLSSSWNAVYGAGFIYTLNDHWSINAGVAYLPLSTDVVLTGTPLGQANVARAKLTINPTDYTLKVGYKF